MATQAKKSSTYHEWHAQAVEDDSRTGADLWRRRDASTLYDYRVIRRRYNELRSIRESGDIKALLFYMHEGFHGNMAGMGSPTLYSRAKAGTKELISNYIYEMVAALEQLEQASADEISPQEKLAFFRRASSCFGRTALMLSGAGSLGPFHIGVLKALAEQDLLPQVISGASAGSVMAAIVGTHHREELLATLSDESKVAMNTGENGEAGGQLSKNDLAGMVENLIPDLTFEEAFQKTGHYINISVAPTQINQRSRLLNAITSPNACIREAVMASCAIPGIFPPVTLAAKSANGERKPYIASRKWVDGSISDDLPAKRLTRLYGVNHFISSQANPAVLWMIPDPNQDNMFAQIFGVYQAAARDVSKAVYPFTMNLVRNFYPINIMTRTWFGLITQEYTADINILPRQRWYNPAKLVARLSTEETNGLISDGERATWPKIEMIKNCTAVSRTIDNALKRLESP